MAMIAFAPAKINVGLHVLERRADGFHNLQTVMLRTGLCDILELTLQRGSSGELRFTQTGIPLEEEAGTNLCVRAWEKISGLTSVPPLHIHLHKQIPVGAGLGGGSSDATHTLLAINSMIDDPCSPAVLHSLAASIGSDCPFFPHEGARLAEGRGERLSPVSLELQGYWLALFHPGIHIATAEAYRGIIPQAERDHLPDLLGQPVEKWKHTVVNDFESSVFRRFPDLAEMKASIYSSGALYASLSGSGSAMYGIFRESTGFAGELARRVLWKGPLVTG